MKRRVWSLVLTAVMVLTMGVAMPAPVLALDVEEPGQASGYVIQTDNSLWIWGWNSRDHVGEGSVVNRVTTKKIMEGVAFVSSQEAHAAAIKTDGSLWAWGSNGHGQIGDGTQTDRPTPAQIMTEVAAVSLGAHQTAAIKTDGSLWVWGGDYDLVPKKIMDDVAAVSVGWGYTMAIKTDGSLWAWGYNFSGQVGDGTTTDRSVPIKIMDGVASVLAGYARTMAIKTDGSLWAWGANYRGQVGDGTRTDRYAPVKIMDGVASISRDSEFENQTTAIKTDGSLWAWGSNGRGQIGDGTTTDRYVPVKVMDGVASVSSGYGYTMAIKTDGSLWAWGGNILGVATTNKLIPAKVMDGVASVSAVESHATAIKTDGSLWAWGTSALGELGDGTTVRRDIPVKIMDNVKFQANASTPAIVSKPSSWAVDRVNTASAIGLVTDDLANGYQAATTRAEFCRAVINFLRVYGHNVEDVTPKLFSDTSDKDIGIAAALGITSGTDTEKNLFSPNQPLTREQAATMLRIVMNVADMDVAPSSAVAWTDAPSIASWAREAADLMYTRGIMGGTSTSALVFSPKTVYTHEQAISTILSLWEAVTK